MASDLTPAKACRQSSGYRYIQFPTLAPNGFGADDARSAAEESTRRCVFDRAHSYIKLLAGAVQRGAPKLQTESSTVAQSVNELRDVQEGPHGGWDAFWGLSRMLTGLARARFQPARKRATQASIMPLCLASLRFQCQHVENFWGRWEWAALPRRYLLRVRGPLKTPARIRIRPLPFDPNGTAHIPSSSQSFAGRKPCSDTVLPVTAGT